MTKNLILRINTAYLDSPKKGSILSRGQGWVHNQGRLAVSRAFSMKMKHLLAYGPLNRLATLFWELFVKRLFPKILDCSYNYIEGGVVAYFDHTNLMRVVYLVLCK